MRGEGERTECNGVVCLVVLRQRASKDHVSLFSTSITPRASSRRRFDSSTCCKAASRSFERESRYLMCLGEERSENRLIEVIGWI